MRKGSGRDKERGGGGGMTLRTLVAEEKWRKNSKEGGKGSR